MVNEAKELKLLAIDRLATTDEEALAALQDVLNWELDYEAQEGENENLKKLLAEKNELSKSLSRTKDELKAVESFVEGTSDYAEEATKQRARLKSIELVRETESNLHSRPLCNSHMEVEIPAAEAINRSLRELTSNLENTIAQRPRLNSYTARLVEERDQLVEGIQNYQQSIKALYKEQDEASRLKDLNLRRGKTIGRISLFMESFQLTAENSSLIHRIREIEAQIERLEEQISRDERESRLNYVLNQINTRMSEWARDLDLEYKGAPLRFDLKKLTIYADTSSRPVPLSQMGSAANWVGFHLLIHFALHSLFSSNRRPTPRFLIIDQPSQAYYPPTNSGESMADGNSDERAVEDMYRFIFKATRELAPELQVIVTDHAKLDLADFENAIVEEWRNGIKLIPQSWLRT
jgi:hypothetical protein